MEDDVRTMIARGWVDGESYNYIYTYEKRYLCPQYWSLIAKGIDINKVERPVTVYRLIAANTIEEKSLRLHQSKRSMADALLEDADLFSQISADEIIRLLKESTDN